MTKPHAAVPHDEDMYLQELRSELRMLMSALNELHHPVYPAPVERVQALEAQLVEVRQALAQRREQVARHA